jgi:hypothetical protein
MQEVNAMGSSRLNGGVRAEQLVTLNTEALKDRLNRVYDRLHRANDTRSSKSFSQEGLFEYLWDLKEVALLEGKSSVELPKNWLDELDQEEASISRC